VYKVKRIDGTRSHRYILEALNTSEEDGEDEDDGDNDNVEWDNKDNKDNEVVEKYVIQDRRDGLHSCHASKWWK
jgi:hypothetical protein